MLKKLDTMYHYPLLVVEYFLFLLIYMLTLQLYTNEYNKLWICLMCILQLDLHARVVAPITCKIDSELYAIGLP